MNRDNRCQLTANFREREIGENKLKHTTALHDENEHFWALYFWALVWPRSKLDSEKKKEDKTNNYRSFFALDGILSEKSMIDKNWHTTIR